MPTHIVVEGDVDRAVVEHFALVPPANLLPTRKGGHRAPGREGAIRTAADLCLSLPEAKTIVVLLDRNGHTPEQLQAEVAAIAAATWGTPGRVDGRYLGHENGRLRLVVAGLPTGTMTQELGLRRFMMDDYLLSLVREESCFDAFVAGENRLPWAGAGKTHGDLLAIMARVTNSLRADGIAVDTSKRWIDLIRAVIGFQASRAVFAQHLVERSPPDAIDRILGALLADLSTD